MVKRDSNRMHNRSIRYFFPVILLFLILLSSCDGNDPSVNAGRLRVKLTDATDISIKELYLDIRELAVYATDTTSMEGEWVTLEYNGGQYNLLQLLNEKSVQLVDQYFPAGKTLRRVRLVLGHDNRFVTFTEKPYPLQLPPEIIEGVVVDLREPVPIMSHIIAGLTIDVNAALSVWESNGNYFLDPSVRAFPEAYGASLRGSVAPPRAAAFVAIMQHPDTLFTLPETDGKFGFPGLQKGEWEVFIKAAEGSLYADTAFVWDIDTTGVVNKSSITLPLSTAIPSPSE